ncbi:MAG: hypothetical protein ABI353_12865 [Isosphaeraceae bacterium]
MLVISGCGEGIDATYGRARDQSVNGTGALAHLFRARGDEVRVTVRLNDEVAAWSDTIVRFAPYSGLIDRREAEWYDDWLAEDPDRRLIFVVRDYDAESEYWSAMLARLPKTADKELRERAERRRDATKDWADRSVDIARNPVFSGEWFELTKGAASPKLCKRLKGPWASGLNPKTSTLTRHRAIKPDPKSRILLTGDGEALVVEQPNYDADVPQILIVANGSFLLNLPLVNRARRPLAGKVVDWSGSATRQVAFVESRSPTDPAGERSPSVFSLLWIEPFGWIAAHLGAFGLLTALVAAARLGRARPEPPAGADRPAAHAEALGDLLARSRDADAARTHLDAYRRWRHASSGPAPPRRGGMT